MGLFKKKLTQLKAALPTTQTKRKRWSAETIDYLTQDEMRRLLSVISNPRDYAIFLLAYRHGLRASEIGLISVDDIDLKQQRIRLQRLKGSLTSTQPMKPDEIKAIKRALKARPIDSSTLFLSRRSEPISRRSLDDLIKSYGELAKIPEKKRHFHALKHSIATHLLDAGLELRFIQEWLGHTQISNTIKYAQLTNRRRDEEVKRAFLSPRIV